MSERKLIYNRWGLRQKYFMRGFCQIFLVCKFPLNRQSFKLKNFGCKFDFSSSIIRWFHWRSVRAVKQGQNTILKTRFVTHPHTLHWPRPPLISINFSSPFAPLGLFVDIFGDWLVKNSNVKRIKASPNKTALHRPPSPSLLARTYPPLWNRSMVLKIKLCILVLKFQYFLVPNM